MPNQNDVTKRARHHLDHQFDRIRSLDALRRPSKGWLRAIRDALGMTTRQLAKRSGVSQPNISLLEKSEAQDSITLGKLREAAEALDCELVYALVPRRPLEETVRQRASQIAEKKLSRLNHTMRLEAQALNEKDLERERERLIDELLRSKPSRLWEDE